MGLGESTQPRLAFRLPARAAASRACGAAGSPPIGTAATWRPSAPPDPGRGTARTPVALGNPVERPRLLHLLTRPDGIPILQKLGERRSRALDDRVLKRFRKIGEGNVPVDRLHIAKQLVRKAAGSALERLHGI